MNIQNRELDFKVENILQRCDEVCLEILEEEIKSISNDLGIKPWNYSFHRFNDVSFINPLDKVIRFKFDENVDFDRMVVSLAHELRHQMQFEVMKSNKEHPKKELWIISYQYIIFSKNSYRRIFNPLEIDAAAYSIYYARKYHNAKLSINNKEIEEILEKYIKENFTI